MSARLPSASLDDLLAQAGWLNRLARHLVRDPDLAEDVAQETWASAAKAPPERGRPVRPWLAEVLRNVIRMRARGDRRRRRWEAAGASSETAAGSPESVQERLELHRLVVECVLALEEPLRATVLLRFFEERSSTEIARSLGVPAGTVRWRLKRAIERLRLDLDGRFGGDRRRWALLLAPGAKVPLFAKGAMVMAKLKASNVALAAIALALLGGGLWIAAGGTRPPPGPEQALASRRTGAERPLRSGWSLPPSDQGVARGSLQVLVRTTEGAPVGGAVVVLLKAAPDADRPGEPPVVTQGQSDGGGDFRFDDLEPGQYAVAAMADGFAPGRQGPITVESDRMAAAELRLTAGGLLLSGRVLDAGGGVVSGAMVTAVLSRSTNPGAPNALVLRALTTERGEYRLFVRSGQHQLRAEAAGYAPAEAWLALKENRTRDFVLTPAARVSGRVIERASGQPVADAEVLLAGEESAARYPTSTPARTDGQGRFLFSSVEAGRHSLSARWGPLVSVPVDVTVNAADGAELNILVDPAFSVSGRVVDGKGLPVAGAIVQMQKGMFFTREPPLKTRSEADGRYVLEGVLPGRYMARAVDQPFPWAEGTVVTVAASEVERIDLVLNRPAVVEGRVLRSDGQPATDLEVHVLSDDRRPNNQIKTNSIAATGTDGRFRVLVMPGKIQVRAHDPQHGSALEEIGVVAGGETRQVALRLGPAGTAAVSGRVTLSNGKPGEGLSVLARGGRASQSTRTDDRGGFTVAGLDPGSLSVEALADEESRHLGSWNWAKQELQLHPGEHRQGIALTLPARGRIAGRVVAPDGTPAGGVTVIAAFEDSGRIVSSAAKRVSAGPDGSFVIEGLPLGKHAISAIHPAHADGELRGVDTGTENALIKLAPAASLAGLVVDGSGRPVSDFWVSLKRTERVRTTAPSYPRQIRDVGGAFLLDRLRGGAYVLEAVTSTGQRARTELSLADGEKRTGLRLPVEDGGRLAGRVVDAQTGAPIAGAEARLNLTDIPEITRTDRQGQFTFERAPPGQLTIHVSAVGYATDRFPIQMPKNGPPASPTMKLNRQRDP
jgi:RNA polymerase sigma factor (sigma-70 family)